MPQPCSRFVALAAAAAIAFGLAAVTRVDEPAATGAPRRGDGFQNSHVEFTPKGIGAR